MLELVFFVAVVALVYRNLRQLSIGRPAKVGGKSVSAEMNQLVEYAERSYLERKYLSAEKLYLRLLKLDHKNTVAYRRLGLIYSAQKNYDEAIESFQIAAHLDPSAVNYYNLGIAMFENSNYIKALAAFEKGLIFEASADLYDAVGRAHLKMSHLAEAIESFKKSTEKSKNKKHFLHLAEAYELAHKKDEAKQTYEKVLKLDPKDQKALRFLHRPVQVS